MKAIGYLLLGFAVPLQFASSIFAFLGRDSLVGTSFGIFTGTWLAYGLTALTSPRSDQPGAWRVLFGHRIDLRDADGRRAGRRQGRRGSSGGDGAARFFLSGCMS